MVCCYSLSSSHVRTEGSRSFIVCIGPLSDLVTLRTRDAHAPEVCNPAVVKPENGSITGPNNMSYNY